MDELADLHSDLNHVLDEIEHLVSITPIPISATTATKTNIEEKRAEDLNDIAEARATAATVKDVGELTDILTWALQRLEEEERKQSAQKKQQTPPRRQQSSNTRKEAEEKVSSDSSKDVHPELVMGNTGWSIHAAPNGKAYWHHEITGESVWEEPHSVLEYRKQTEVQGWGIHPSPTGKPYWHNEHTGESVWVEPAAMKQRRLKYQALSGISFEQVRSSSSSSSKVQSDDDDDLDDVEDENEENEEDEDRRHVMGESKMGGGAKQNTDRQKGGNSNDTRVLRRQLKDTMRELERSLMTVHDLTEDRDALVEALDKLSTESEDMIDDLRLQLKRAKRQQGNSSNSNSNSNSNSRNGGGSSRGEGKSSPSSYDHSNTEQMEELQVGLESALEELQSEMEKNDRLQTAVETLRDENDRLKEVTTTASQSPMRKTFSVNDAEAHKLADRSASLLQSRMRGFLARKEFEQKVEDHLMDDVVIPDFSHLNDRRSGRGRYTNDGYGRR